MYMNKLGRLLMVAATALALTACSEPRLDASSEASLQASAEKMMKKLPSQKQAEFTEALSLVVFRQMQQVDFGRMATEGPGHAQNQLRQAVDGKTADEIIAEANRLRAEMAAQQREAELAEIDELEEKRQADVDAVNVLAQFEVSNPKFYWDESEFLPSNKRVISLSVRNGTTSPISRVVFEGTLTIPGRTEPLLVAQFSKNLPEPMGPGESSQWEIRPSFLDKWQSVRPPENGLLSVRVIELAGPYDPVAKRSFLQDDAERLASLRAKHAGPAQSASH